MLELVHRLRVVPACSVVEDALVGGQVGVATDRGQLDPLPVAQVDEVLQLARLPAITVPTVVLHGADNGVSPARSSEGQARLFVGRHVRRLIPLLIRRDGRTVGFALVSRGSPASDDPDDLDLQEFFVLRRYRRMGVGREAARLQFELAARELAQTPQSPWTLRKEHVPKERGCRRPRHLARRPVRPCRGLCARTCARGSRRDLRAREPSPRFDSTRGGFRLPSRPDPRYTVAPRWLANVGR